MKKLIALLTGVTFLFGAAGMGLAEKKEEKKDNATKNATKEEAPKKKKKVEGC